MESLMDWVTGTGPSPFAGHFGEGLARRSNTPSGAYDQVLRADTPAADQHNRLWAMDRILEPQTIPRFIEFAITGELLSGAKTQRPLLGGEQLDYIVVPMSEWAPAPYNNEETPILDAVMQRTGSMQDSSRIVPITKELLAMKARVWEGIMPLSETRWMELDLDSPDRFHEACQFISAVTDVFHYLNIPPIKANLRETYNLIWGHLDMFDQAVHAMASDTTDPDFSLAALWHEYMDDYFDSMSRRSHRWVIDHIDRLRAPIMEILSQDTDIDAFDVDDEYGANLADLIHDLHEGAAQADSSIFVPMDGYRGGSLPSQDEVPGDTSYQYREEPIEFSASTEKRKADYYFRLRYLSHRESFKIENLLNKNSNSPASLAQEQVRAQIQARRELRGNDDAKGEEAPPRWVAQARRYLAEEDGSLFWGYIGFRTSYDHSDEEWERFKTNFHADMSNWGSELGDINDIRALSVVEWRDVKQERRTNADGVLAMVRG